MNNLWIFAIISKKKIDPWFCLGVSRQNQKAISGLGRLMLLTWIGSICIKKYGLLLQNDSETQGVFFCLKDHWQKNMKVACWQKSYSITLQQVLLQTENEKRVKEPVTRLLEEDSWHPENPQSPLTAFGPPENIPSSKKENHQLKPPIFWASSR